MLKDINESVKKQNRKMHKITYRSDFDNIRNINEHFDETIKFAGIHTYTLGQLLRSKRRDLFLTQQQAAKLTGISQGRISRYEQDLTIPTWETLGTFMKKYDMSENERKEANKLRAFADCLLPGKIKQLFSM